MVTGGVGIGLLDFFGIPCSPKVLCCSSGSGSETASGCLESLNPENASLCSGGYWSGLKVEILRLLLLLDQLVLKLSHLLMGRPCLNSLTLSSAGYKISMVEVEDSNPGI